MVHLMGERQRWAWVAAAWSIVTAACLCGYGWNWVLPGALAAALYHRWMDRRLPAAGLAAIYDGLGLVGKLLLALTFLWLIWLLAWSAARMELAFPKVQSFPALSWVLLALAAWGSRKGSSACAGCSGVLCLILLVLYGMIVGFAVPDLDLEQMLPTGEARQAPETFGLLLLPAVVWLLPVAPGEKRQGSRITVALAAGSAVLAAWTAGVLSPQLAAARPAPLYDLAQSISILGVVERIEPLLSAAMTMGLFSLLSMLACACQAIGGRFKPWNGYGTLACVLAAFCLPWARSTLVGVVVVGCVILEAVTPVLAVQIFKQKGRKREN